jgi:hypothetical protein
MKRTIKRYRKADNIAIVIFGVIFIVGSVFCLVVSVVQGTKHDRWEVARQLRELGELREIGKEGDVTVSGAIASWTPAAQQGFALYEVWEREVRYSGNQKHETWSQAYAHKPDFELLFGAHPIVIQSERAALQKTQTVQLDVKTRLQGFLPGDEVTVMGTVVLPDDPSTVQAEIVCGGDRGACLGQITQWALIAALGAVVLVLGGMGLVVFGVRRSRAGE